jgi:hypothetical protein
MTPEQMEEFHQYAMAGFPPAKVAEWEAEIYRLAREEAYREDECTPS